MSEGLKKKFKVGDVVTIGCPSKWMSYECHAAGFVDKMRSQVGRKFTIERIEHDAYDYDLPKEISQNPFFDKNDYYLEEDIDSFVWNNTMFQETYEEIYD